MIGEFESPTGNLPGDYPGSERRATAVEGEGTPFFYGVPMRAGDRGRIGDVQLGKLSWPLWGKGFSAAVAESGSQPRERAAAPRPPPAAMAFGGDLMLTAAGPDGIPVAERRT